MDWRIKGVIQKTLGMIPGGVRANDVLQRTFGELRDVEKTIDSKIVDDWVVLASLLRELKVPIADARMVEVGTGWFPVFPLCFALAGARVCHTYDLQAHLSRGLTTRAVRRIAHHLRNIAEAAHVPLIDVERRYAQLVPAENPAVLLNRAGVTYHAPADASRTALTATSIDIVYSNSVLEHVTPTAITAIFKESARILATGGVAIHSVNCGDHYAYFDRSITAINYLRYSARQWQRWDNAMLYQNRLRPVDFLKLAGDAGLDVLLARYKPKPKLLKALTTLRVAKEFSSYPPEELCSTSIDFVARPARSGELPNYTKG